MASSAGPWRADRKLEVSVHKEGEAAEPEDYPLPFADGVAKSGGKRGAFNQRVIAEFVKHSR